MSPLRSWAPSRRLLLAGAAAAGLTPFRAGADPAESAAISVTSPNGRLRVSLSLPRSPADCPAWSAQLDGRAVLEPAPLALVLGDGSLLGPGAIFIDQRLSSGTGSWRPPYGIAREYDQSHREAVLLFEDRKRAIRFEILLRAQDDGVALRYLLRDAPGGHVTLGGEATHFRLPPGTSVYSSRDEGEYARSSPGRIAPAPHPELTASTDKGDLADTPITAVTADGLHLSISESDRLHYPRLMLRSADAPDSIVTHLMRFPGRATGYSGPGDTHPAPTFSVATPFATPWRVVTIATSPAALIEKAGLIATLASPCRLADTSWIRPGRAFRIRKPYTTDNALTCVDFAVRRKLEFVEFDAHWYGDGTDPSDATMAIPELDMPRILAYAKARNIGLILYVDRVPAMRQLDEILRTYQGWGVAGIKFGFVWEGRQEDTDFIYGLVRKCGEHRLMVNLHDNLRPAGLERTLPNYVALEGVRGNEQFPTARHNVTLPFTRALSGPIDYTICYAHDRNRTTNAHQLAMAAVYYNPLTFLYWYDAPQRFDTGQWPALHWFDECPTTWDETRALAGAIGEYVAVARRNGERWFLGAMTNEEPRVLRLPLSFLGKGMWDARIHADGVAGERPNATPVVVSRRTVSAADTIELRVAPSGGQAILFTQAGWKMRQADRRGGLPTSVQTDTVLV